MAFGKKIGKGGSRYSAAKRQFLGQDAFPNGENVCKPIAPGRRTKPIGGPVHPGFTPKKPAAPAPKFSPGLHIQVSSQSNDLYKPIRKDSTKKSKKK